MMFIELAKKRRSVKQYTSQEVEQEKIDGIIEAGLRAPSGRAIRPWEFVVVRDKELLAKLSVAKPGGLPERLQQGVHTAVEARHVHRADVAQPQQDAQCPFMMVLKVLGCYHGHRHDFSSRDVRSVVILVLHHLQQIIYRHICCYNVRVVHTAPSFHGRLALPF